MGIANFLYRQKQKWNYHTAKNDFEKKIAEINRHQLLVYLSKNHFKIKGLDISFNKKIHGFLIDRYEILKLIIDFPGSSIIIERNKIYYKSKELTLKISTAEEIFIIYEIFLKRCYEVIAEFEFNVIDIGMNVGFASLFFAQNTNIKKIYGFEPFKATYKEAVTNFKLNKEIATKIIPENLGLGSRNCNIKVNYQNSLKGKNNVAPSNIGVLEKVNLKCADDALESILGQDPNMKFLIKMDCEGSEYEIFERYIEKQLPEQLFGFIIEWHFRDPQLIIDILVRDHFKIHKIHNGELGFITAFR